MKKSYVALAVFLSISGASLAQSNPNRMGAVATMSAPSIGQATLAPKYMAAGHSLAKRDVGSDIMGDTTDEAIIRVGASQKVGPRHGPAGLPGFGLYSLTPKKPFTIIAAKPLYENMRTGFDPATGIATIGGNRPHDKMGTWLLNRAIGSDGNEVYYGVWNGPAPDAKGRPSTDTAYVAYVVGDKVTRNLDAVKGSTFNYTTHGVGQGSEYYSGTLTANFNAAGTGGTLTGGIASAQTQITIGSAGLPITIDRGYAEFNGGATGPYYIHGLFYGTQAQALAGTAQNEQDPSKSVAFGGTR